MTIREARGQAQMPISTRRPFAALSAVKRPLQPYSVANMLDHILVTGGTGFIGGAVLAQLIDTEHWAKTLVMVRGKDPADARSRIVRSIGRFHPGRDINALVDDRQIICAGLEDAAHLTSDPRVRRVTHVIHSAAVTAFSDHPRIRATNVDASLAFVQTLTETARIERFVNVGTAWCVGIDADALVQEDGEQGSDNHIVPYTASKIEFERSVRKLHPGMPFVSARPSIVIGHSRLGTAPSGSIYWVFRSAQILGQSACSLDERIDIVPVDWVANALIHLMLKRDVWFDTYQLSTGEQSFSTFAEIEKAIAKGRDMAPLGHHGFKCVSPRELTKAVYDNRAKLSNANPLILARALSLYSKFAESGVLFDNARTLSEDISPPPPFHSYAEVCARTAEGTSIAAQMEDDFK